MPSDRGSSAKERDDSSRSMVPCRGHAFDDKLVCPCGMTWGAHQQSPQPCPLDARGRSRHSGRSRPDADL